MSKEIMEKLDLIEAEQVAKIESVKLEVKAEFDATVATFEEKVANLEAKVASINVAPSIIKIEKSIHSDVNKMVKEQLAAFHKGNGRTEKELKMFEDESHYAAYLKEASA